MKRNVLYFVCVVLAIVFNACQKDDDAETVVTKEVNIKVGESFKLDGSGFSADSELNTFIASISNSGEVKGLHDGKTNCTVKSKDKTYKLDIVVSANTTMYVDMKIFLGINKTEIEKIYGAPLSGDNQVYIYKSLALEALNSFTYVNNKVTTGTVAIKDTHATSVNKHLLDRYKYIGTSNGMLIYIDASDEKDAQTVAGLSTKSNHIYVTYMPMSAMKSLKIKSANGLDVSSLAALMKALN